MYLDSIYDAPVVTYSTPSPTVSETAGIIAGIFLVFFFLAIAAATVLTVIGRWKIFTKAGQEGWKSLIPIYSEYTTLKILNMEPLLAILYIIPVSNFFLNIVVRVKLAQAFKKGVGFAIGLILLPPIFEMILGFGSAKFHELPSSK